MFKKKDKNFHPILKHVIYLGSAKSKLVHSTQNPCPEAYLVPVDERWYIKTIPVGGGYTKCSKCYPDGK